jgi:predicted DNA-binding transcriptional regulator YafY
MGGGGVWLGLRAMTERLERLINLVIALRETRVPMPAADIRTRVAGYGQQDHEAFRRMFERDKADLRALGVPVETAPVDAVHDLVGYRIPPERYELPSVSLEPDELAALGLALHVTGLADDAAAGLRKLEVDAGGEAAVEGAAAALDVDLSAPHRDSLLDAVATRTAVRFRYRPLGRTEQARLVEPHALVHRAGRWYVVAHDRDRGARRAFRLDRIAGEVRSAGSPGAFPPPPAADVDDVLPDPPGDAPAVARVRAAPHAAWQVAQRARSGGEPAPGPTDEPWSAFTVAVGDVERFVGWAVEHAGELIVDEPPALRAAVVERLRTAAGRP